MAEWLKAHAWKACVGETLPRVRIPLSPPIRINNLQASQRGFWVTNQDLDLSPCFPLRPSNRFLWVEASCGHAVHCALAGQGRADRKSNGIVHITDWFTTLLTMAGLPVPDDRVIGRQGSVGFRNRKAGEIEPRRLYWNGEKLYGVKWQNFKLVLMEQKYLTDPLCRWDFRPSSTWSRIPKSASRIQPDTGKLLPVVGSITRIGPIASSPRFSAAGVWRHRKQHFRFGEARYARCWRR